MLFPLSTLPGPRFVAKYTANPSHLHSTPESTYLRQTMIANEMGSGESCMSKPTAGICDRERGGVIEDGCGFATVLMQQRTTSVVSCKLQATAAGTNPHHDVYPPFFQLLLHAATIFAGTRQTSLRSSHSLGRRAWESCPESDSLRY